MNSRSEVKVACPYCGESLDVLLDPEELDQEYIEDCQVCCRPIIFSTTEGSDGLLSVSVRSEDDTY